MTQPEKHKRSVDKAADIIGDAGGKVVGRTRLQKIAYLLELTGVGDGFVFEYKHYGPYSEDLASAVRNAHLLGLVSEDEQMTSWGGFYSIFTTDRKTAGEVSRGRQELAMLGAKADSIALELAATAAFLASEGSKCPWEEVKRRKPEKSDSGRIEKAKELYRQLQQIKVPTHLPNIT